MAIQSKGQKIGVVSYGSQVIGKVYRGAKLVYSSVKSVISCFSSGAWFSSKPWVGTEAWV